MSHLVASQSVICFTCDSRMFRVS